MVCFLSNALPRYWPETKLFKNRINENQIQIRTLNRGIVKIQGLFFCRFLTAESREIFDVWRWLWRVGRSQKLIFAKFTCLVYFLYCFAHSKISPIKFDSDHPLAYICFTENWSLYRFLKSTVSKNSTYLNCQFCQFGHCWKDLTIAVVSVGNSFIGAQLGLLAPGRPEQVFSDSSDWNSRSP